ncbi:MAG: nucleoside permease [Phycisphaeraceae bacterium]
MQSIKLQYFLGYAVLGSVSPYASVYLEERGLSDAQIGVVMSLSGLSALLMPTLMSLLADLKLENRTLLRGTFFVAASALTLLLSGHSYWWLLPTFLLWSLAISPIMSLTDGMLFSVRGIRDAAGKDTPPYHRIRVYGTIGFIAPSFVLYVLLAKGVSVGLALLTGVAVALLACGNTWFLPATRGRVGDPSAGAEVPNPHPPANQGKALPTLLALKRMLAPDVALFCFAMWLIWISTSSYYTFYPLYLTRVVGFEEKWLGLIVSLGVVLEIGYVLAFGWLLKKMGTKGVMVLGTAAATMRMALLWAVPTWWSAIGVQILHGLTVLAIFLMPPLYLNHRAEPGFRNSIQGLYAMCVFGTGRIVGNNLSGQIAQAWDGDIRQVFMVMTLIAGAATLLFALVFRDRSGTTLTP